MPAEEVARPASGHVFVFVNTEDSEFWQKDEHGNTRPLTASEVGLLEEAYGPIKTVREAPGPRTMGPSTTRTPA